MQTKPFWVQPEPSRPIMRYTDFFKAERYAFGWLHRLQGQEILIMHDVTIVAYCRLSPHGSGQSFITPAWAGKLDFRSKPKRAKKYKFIGSDRQLTLLIE